MADDVPSWTAAGLPPRVEVQGYERMYADAVQSTEMAAGNFKSRLKTIMAAEPVQAGIFVTLFKLGLFRTFYRETTAMGSEPFWFPDQAFQGATLLTAGGVPLTRANGAPAVASAHWLVMFRPGSPPRETEGRGGMFRVSFSLLVLP